MKAFYYALFAIGFIGCSTYGIGKALERASGDWTSPTMIAGSVLGVAILALTAAFAIGYRPAILPTDLSMVVALGVLIATKVGVSVVQAAVVAARA